MSDENKPNILSNKNFVGPRGVLVRNPHRRKESLLLSVQAGRLQILQRSDYQVQPHSEALFFSSGAEAVCAVSAGRG